MVSGQSDVSCFGGSNGSISLSTQGGTTPYQYNWSAGSGTSTATTLSAGTYTVTVTDAGGCTSTVSTIIHQPSAIQLPVTTNPASCGNANGTATVVPSGGSGGYTYLWNTGVTNSSILNVAAGSYTVTVSDVNGCSATATAGVNNLGAPTLNIVSVTNVTCYNGNNGAITASASGGTGSLTWQWSPASGSSSTAGNCATSSRACSRSSCGSRRPSDVCNRRR